MQLASEPWQPLPQQGEVLAGKYRIERLLGRGGMGTVFLAENTATGKLVALKWLDAAVHDEVARARFQREARAAGQVNHPHVVDVYDVSEHGGAPFLVMEYLRGRSLQEVLEQEKVISVERILEWLIPVMDGVSAAHALGIVHRDLKPDNIFLCERPDGGSHPKVLDFGVAKTLSPVSCDAPLLTRPGALLGSPSYMAIEQIDSLAVDARTDVYAFGVILYRAIAGVLPYENRSLSQLIGQISGGVPRPLREHQPGIPVELEAIIARAMARDASARFESVEQLRRALLPFRNAAAASALARPISGVRALVGAHGRSLKRRRVWALAIAIAIVVLAGGLAFHFGWNPSRAALRRASTQDAALSPVEPARSGQPSTAAGVGVEARPRARERRVESEPRVDERETPQESSGVPGTSVRAPSVDASGTSKPRRLAPVKKNRVEYEPPLL